MNKRQLKKLNKKVDQNKPLTWREREKFWSRGAFVLQKCLNGIVRERDRITLEELVRHCMPERSVTEQDKVYRYTFNCEPEAPRFTVDENFPLDVEGSGDEH